MKRFILMGTLLTGLFGAVAAQADAQVVYRRPIVTPGATYRSYFGTNTYYNGPRGYYSGATPYYGQRFYRPFYNDGYSVPNGYFYGPRYTYRPYWDGGYYWR